MLDTRVKERLTGAIILVAVLVLLVPELLTGSGRSAQSGNAATSADGAQMRSYTINLADDAARRPTPAPGTETAAPEPQPAQPMAGTTQVESADAPAVAPEDHGDQGDPTGSSSGAPAPTPAAEPEMPAAPVARVESVAPAKSPARSDAAGWAIQVGSFASRENAERLARNLKGKGFAATVSESSGKGKRLWRVRVGPEADRAAAVALGARLRAAGQSGAVVPYP
jgi:DedD protein